MAPSDQSEAAIVGGNLPDFDLPDHEGKSWYLADHLAHGPVLLVFYRGDW